jgi:hypothetical protein
MDTQIYINHLKTKVNLLFHPMLSDFRNSTALWKVHKLCPFVVLVQQHLDDDEYGALVK